MEKGLEAELSRAIFLVVMVLVGATPTARAQISTPCTASMITSFTPCFNFITGSSANGGSPTQECCKSFKSMMRTSVECTCLVITANVPIPLPINRTLSISLPRACNTGGIPMQCKATGTPLPPPGPVLFAPPPPPAVIAPSPSMVADSPSFAPSPYTVTDSPSFAPSPLSPRASKAVKASTPSSSPASAAAPESAVALVPAPAPEIALSPEFDVPTDTTPTDAPVEPNTGTTTPRPPGIRPVVNPFNSNSSPGSIYSPPSLLMILVGMITTVHKFC